MEPPNEVGNVEEDWSLIPESVLRSLVQVHDQLFGSGKFLKCVSYISQQILSLLVYFCFEFILSAEAFFASMFMCRRI